mmetsp:Transcript_2731/g.5691  ORF Transcript_2731/g.5691 Transcript_2731/m.5691 type:complete len:80 (-) Transcript_2731:52-291(-)
MLPSQSCHARGGTSSAGGAVAAARCVGTCGEPGGNVRIVLYRLIHKTATETRRSAAAAWKNIRAVRRLEGGDFKMETIV